MKILLTGAIGFICRHVLMAMQHQGIGLVVVGCKRGQYLIAGTELTRVERGFVRLATFAAYAGMVRRSSLIGGWLNRLCRNDMQAVFFFAKDHTYG